MSIEYFDGWDEYSFSQILRYWSTQTTGGGQTASITASAGRNGTPSYRIGNLLTNPAGLVKTLTNQATRTIGLAIAVSALPSGGDTAICGYLDAGSQQVDLRLATTGFLKVTRNGTVLATSSFALSAATYYYIEFKATIDPSAGVYEVRVNGIARIGPTTGANTRNTANSEANQVFVGPFSVNNASSGPTWDFDDFYVNNDGSFYGDCRVETRLANANGAIVTWTPLAGSNWQEISRNPATDDASYNSTATPLNVDLYSFPNLATGSGSVKAVMTCPVMRNDSAGTVTAQSVYYISSTPYLGSLQTIGSTTYAFYPDIQSVDPSTSAAWTVAAVNAAQFGIERIT